MTDSVCFQYTFPPNVLSINTHFAQYWPDYGPFWFHFWQEWRSLADICASYQKAGEKVQVTSCTFSNTLS